MKIHNFLPLSVVLGACLLTGEAAAQSAAPAPAPPPATRYERLEMLVQYGTTPSGYTFYVGDTLRLGRGSLPNDEFRYVHEPVGLSGGSFRPVSAYWQGKVVSVLRLTDGMSGGQWQGQLMAEFRLGTFKLGYASLDAAIAAGEVVPTSRQRRPPPAPTPVPTEATPARLGVADELLKLKALLDAGAITRAEYDKQKARLLSE